MLGQNTHTHQGCQRRRNGDGNGIACFGQCLIVELDRIGRFRVTVSSKGAVTEDDYHQELIKGVNVRFSPAKYIKEVLSKTDFAKKPLYIRETEVEEEEEEEP